MATEQSLRKLFRSIERQRIRFIPKVRRAAFVALGKQAKPFFDQFVLTNTLDNINASIDFVIEEDAIKKLYTELYNLVGEAFAVTASNLVKHGKYAYVTKEDDDFLVTQWNLEVQRAIETKIGTLVTAVTQTTKDFLALEMQKVIELGLSIPDARKAIMERFTFISRNRAQTIARTEILRASEMANHWGAVQTGLALDKQWLHSGILKGSRPDHVAMNGQTRDINADFDVNGEKAQYPRDPRLTANQSVNCRCTAINVPKGTRLI